MPSTLVRSSAPFVDAFDLVVRGNMIAVTFDSPTGRRLTAEDGCTLSAVLSVDADGPFLALDGGAIAFHLQEVESGLLRVARAVIAIEHDGQTERGYLLTLTRM